MPGLRADPSEKKKFHSQEGVEAYLKQLIPKRTSFMGNVSPVLHPKDEKFDIDNNIEKLTKDCQA